MFLLVLVHSQFSELPSITYLDTLTLKTPDHTTMAWTPPSVSQLVMTNCTAIGRVFGQMGAEQANNVVTGVPIDVAYDFAKSIVPQNWTGRDDEANILTWMFGWSDNTTGAILVEALTYSLDECNTTICPQLQYPGDSDLAGIGASQPTPEEENRGC